MLITVTQNNHQKDLHCKPVCLIQAVVQELNLIKRNSIIFADFLSVLIKIDLTFWITFSSVMMPDCTLVVI